jgi:hypothetical protein
MVDLETEPLADNANFPDSRWCYIYNARVQGKLKQTLKSTAAGNTGWIQEGNEVNGYPRYMTNILPNSSIIFGDMSQVLIGMWSGTEILVDPYSQSSARLVRLVASQACDYNWEHVEAFCHGRYVLST